MLLGIEHLKERLWSERVIGCFGFIAGVSWLIERSREHIECGVVVGRRLIGKSIDRLVVMLGLSIKMLNENSRNGANHS